MAPEPERMMRLVLFETSTVPCSVPLDKVLHVLTDPHVFSLPLLRHCYAGGLIYQGQFVPLLKGGKTQAGVADEELQPVFVLVCEAEFGLIGVPADKIVRITNIGEADSENTPGDASQDKICEINNCEYRLLDLNRVVEDPDFTLCG